MKGMNETPEKQEANRIIRKGMKRPESGHWPVASDKMVKGIAYRKSMSEAMGKALHAKKDKTYTSPTGSKHRIGSNKHKYWEDIEKRGNLGNGD